MDEPLMHPLKQLRERACMGRLLRFLYAETPRVPTSGARVHYYACARRCLALASRA